MLLKSDELISSFDLMWPWEPNPYWLISVSQWWSAWVWLKFIHLFWRYGADWNKPFFNILWPLTFKIRLRSPKYNHHSFASPSNKYVQVKFKVIHLFRRYHGADKVFFNSLQPHVTLEMGPRLPKHQIFSMFLWYIYTSLVKIHPFVQEIKCRQEIFQYSFTSYDLVNETKVTKI